MCWYSWRYSLAIIDGMVYIDGKKLLERAKPQFSYNVVVDGKTPIDFEYLVKTWILP
jgi:signal peptidase I